MTAVYRMTADGWTSDQAFGEMKQYKFGADFLHSEFKDFVYSYHAEPARIPAIRSEGVSRPATVPRSAPVQSAPRSGGTKKD